MWPRATNPENWLPQSQFIKVISTVRIGRTGGSEIHERVAQLFVVVHKPASARNTWLETARENRKKQLRINCSCFFSMVTRTGFEPMLKA